MIIYRAMKILEGSDTQLLFHITQTEDWLTTDVDLTQYQKVLLEIRYITGVVEILGTVWQGEWEHSYVTFDILSEGTQGKVWKVSCDIWGVKNESRIRFNSNTIQGEVLSSIKVPEWNADD